MQPVILDTDVASLSHKRKLTGPLATRLIGRKPLITFVTFGELTKWTEIRHWGTRSRQELADWLSGIPILPGDEAVAASWGRLSAAGIQRGRPRPINACGSRPVPSPTTCRWPLSTSRTTRTSEPTTVCASSARSSRSPQAQPDPAHKRGSGP